MENKQLPADVLKEINAIADRISDKLIAIVKKELGEATQYLRIGWIKASERLPKHPDDPGNHFRLHGKKVNGNFYQDSDGMMFFEVRGSTHEPYQIGWKSFQYLEWLDESASPAAPTAWIKADVKRPDGWQLARIINSAKRFPVKFAPHVIADIAGKTYEPKELEYLSDESPAAPQWTPATTKPEHNVGVLVFIPGEDNHITSGMWDVSNKWVLLDEYRTPDEEVTHWMPLPAFPEGYTWNEIPGDWVDAIKEAAKELGIKPAAGREEAITLKEKGNALALALRRLSRSVSVHPEYSNESEWRGYVLSAEKALAAWEGEKEVDNG